MSDFILESTVKELLRHKSIAVTTDKHVKAIPEVLLKGIKAAGGCLENRCERQVMQRPSDELF
jgi:hypothetical protein